MKIGESFITGCYDLNGTEVRFNGTQSILNSEFPDFMLVGPQRTGTTWLWSNLMYHPNICMSYPKEPHYFSNLEKSQSFREEDFQAYLSYFRLPAWLLSLRTMHALLYCRKWLDFRAFGEASASYAVMKEGTIRFMHQLNPRLKVIMIVRNPVERALSNLRFDLFTTRDDRPVTPDDIERFLNDEYQKECSHYSQNIERWKDILGGENVMLINFDQMRLYPGQVLNSVFRFLGVPALNSYLNKTVLVSRAKSKNVILPQKYEQLLIERFRDEIIRLKLRYQIDFTDSFERTA